MIELAEDTIGHPMSKFSTAGENIGQSGGKTVLKRKSRVIELVLNPGWKIMRQNTKLDIRCPIYLRPPENKLDIGCPISVEAKGKGKEPNKTINRKNTT